MRTCTYKYKQRERHTDRQAIVYVVLCLQTICKFILLGVAKNSWHFYDKTQNLFQIHSLPSLSTNGQLADDLVIENPQFFVVDDPFSKSLSSQ